MTAVKLTPDSRPQHIQTLITSVDRYNPSNCHLLEDYLQEQLAKDTYDLAANLALLKLYQFNPPLLSPSAVLSILFLSLAHAPFAPDFNLAWSLLSDSFVVGAALPPPPPGSEDEDDDDDDDDEEAAPRLRAPAQPHGERATAEHLKHLSALLQGRKFKLFWSKLRSSPERDHIRETVNSLRGQSQGFDDALRANIAAEVEGTFKSIPKKTLESFLGLEASSDVLGPLIESRKWTLAGDVVQIPANESNSPASTLQREHIEIDQLSRVLERSNAP